MGRRYHHLPRHSNRIEHSKSFTDEYRSVALLVSKNFALLVACLYFGVLLLLLSCEVTVSRRRRVPTNLSDEEDDVDPSVTTFRQRRRSRNRAMFRVKTAMCPALKKYHGMMSMFAFFTIFLFLACQAFVEVDACWADSIAVYNGVHPDQVKERATMDFLHKAMGVFCTIIMVQLSLWDTTPSAVAAGSDDELEGEMLGVGPGGGGTTSRAERRARRRRQRTRRLAQSIRSKLRWHFPNLLSCCYFYLATRIVHVFVKVSEVLMKDTNCSQYSESGPNGISLDYAMGTFALLSFLRFIVKVRRGNVYDSATYSLAGFLWRVFGGCNFKTGQEKVVVAAYVGLVVVNGFTAVRVLATGINNLRQVFYGVLVGLMFHLPYIRALDVIVPEGVQTNLPYMQTPSERREGHVYGRRRFQVITLLGTLLSAYGFVGLLGLMRLRSHVRNAVLFSGWFYVDLAAWGAIMYVFLLKIGAPRQGFVGYSEVIASQGAWNFRRDEIREGVFL